MTEKDLNTPDLDEELDEEEQHEDGAEATESEGGETDSAQAETLAVDDNGEDREAIRERRRQERQQRKERIKEEREMLQRQLAAERESRRQLEERLAVIERKSSGAEAAQVDAALKQADQAYSYYKEQARIAVEATDGRAAVEAQEKMAQVLRRREDLARIKAAMANKQTAQPPLDPRLQSHASEWVKRNPWYDAAGGDPDSEITRAIDTTLAREGWNPATAEYWQELDARVKKYLPHKAAKAHNPGSSRTRPTSPVSGSGREAGGSAAKPAGYTLSADRVAALKEAGMWNDPKARADAIERFRQYDKQNSR